MKRVSAYLVSFMLFSTVEAIPSEPTVSQSSAYLDRIDALFDKGVKENYRQSGLESIRESLSVCEEALKKAPDDYELLWRFARSAHQYAETARNIELEGLKDISLEWGKRGMEVAEKAQKIRPDRVEAYFWEAACIGKYSDATGPVTAIKEGFYNKSKNAMTKAYELDKTYNDCDPVFGMAMFHVSLPFPLKDKKKALQYYREFEKLTTWTVNIYVRCVYAAHMLMEVRDAHYKEEVKQLLDKALSDPHPRKFYVDWAKDLQSKLE